MRTHHAFSGALWFFVASTALAGYLFVQFAFRTTVPSFSSQKVDAGVDAGKAPALTVTRDKQSRVTVPASGDASVEGTVLNQFNEPIAGVRLDLVDIGRRPKGSKPARFTMVTGDDGAFRFVGLRAVEYQLNLESRPGYAGTSEILRPSARPVLLSVQERPSATVTGEVVDEAGAPISGVRIVAAELGSDKSETDNKGHFAVNVPLSTNIPDYLLRFIKPGYKNSSLIIPNSDLRPGTAERKLVMQAAGAPVRVQGMVIDEMGRALSDEQVNLQSVQQGTRYTAVSDSAGVFRFADVASDDDYTVSIDATGPYSMYRRDGLDLTRAGSPLNIVLKELSTAPIQGRLVDAAGEGVANETLQVQSTSATGRVQMLASETDGTFSLGDVPTGFLTLRSLGSPDIEISGIRHPADTRKPVPIRLDIGDGSLSGRVAGRDGVALAGADVRLEGFYRRNDMVSRVDWSMHTNAVGEFEFNSLGKGPYQLIVNAGGYDRVSVTADLASAWMEVRMTPKK